MNSHNFGSAWALFAYGSVLLLSNPCSVLSIRRYHNGACAITVYLSTSLLCRVWATWMTFQSHGTTILKEMCGMHLPICAWHWFTNLILRPEFVKLQDLEITLLEDWQTTMCLFTPFRLSPLCYGGESCRLAVVKAANCNKEFRSYGSVRPSRTRLIM